MAHYLATCVARVLAIANQFQLPDPDLWPNGGITTQPEKPKTQFRNVKFRTKNKLVMFPQISLLFAPRARETCGG